MKSSMSGAILFLLRRVIRTRYKSMQRGAFAMADLGVYSSIGVRSAAEELFRRFEQARACRLAVTWSTAPMLVARIEAGAPKPDISTPEALKATLLRAKSIAYSEPSAGGASGVYFAKLLERMGIAEQMKAKTKYPPAGGFSGELLLTGEAELAV